MSNQQYVEVCFRIAGQLYLFDAGDLELQCEEFVIVQTEHGLAVGMVKSIKHISATPPANLRPNKVLRRASAEDVQRQESNRRKETEAFDFCRERIEVHKLPMKLVRAEYLYSGSKLLFYFSAEGRIDFRSLVRDLARHFRMRIEMRQIGVRDSAKLIGGIGPCGQELCCSRFLRNFNPVSIRMAKDQNLTLNPQKVSGVCGRLMCCLSYEQELYQAVRRALPKVGRVLQMPEGKARVREVFPLRESVRLVFWELDPPVEKELHLSELAGYEEQAEKMWEHFQEVEQEANKHKKKARRGIEPLMEPRGKLSSRTQKEKRAFHDEKKEKRPPRKPRKGREQQRGPGEPTVDEVKKPTSEPIPPNPESPSQEEQGLKESAESRGRGRRRGRRRRRPKPGEEGRSSEAPKQSAEETSPIKKESVEKSSVPKATSVPTKEVKQAAPEQSAESKTSPETKSGEASEETKSTKGKRNRRRSGNRRRRKKK
ncbi:MAG: hypothetical protein CL920_17335 [Deltaproteobacteria bacterium]|nr:hypothetical protein [Deltaproteobacteria bacterium]|tara:strand:+ start:6853 stop:8304 length:1452 start_codon:yes stop_codon:yes gene_type:complete